MKKSMRDYLPNESPEYWLISDVNDAVLEKVKRIIKKHPEVFSEFIK